MIFHSFSTQSLLGKMLLHSITKRTTYQSQNATNYSGKISLFQRTKQKQNAERLANAEQMLVNIESKTLIYDSRELIKICK